MAQPRHQRRQGVFRAAVDAAEHLTWKAGLQVIKPAEGGGQIAAGAGRTLLGGAVMDDDCKAAYPNSARWDYVLGVERGREHVAHFVEVHSADTRGVSQVADKLAWLREFLERPRQAPLKALPAEYHWVASGRVNIPRHLPQFRRLQTTLRKQGLQGPSKALVLE